MIGNGKEGGDLPNVRAVGFKQGSTAMGPVVTFDYKRAGSYDVTLTVQDAAGIGTA
jgi:hypothetical protein